MTWWTWLLIGVGLLVASWMLLVFLAARLPEGSLQRVGRISAGLRHHGAASTGRCTSPSAGETLAIGFALLWGVVTDRPDSRVPPRDRSDRRCRGRRPGLSVHSSSSSSAGRAGGVARQAINHRARAGSGPTRTAGGGGRIGFGAPHSCRSGPKYRQHLLTMTGLVRNLTTWTLSLQPASTASQTMTCCMQFDTTGDCHDVHRPVPCWRATGSWCGRRRCGGCRHPRDAG